MKNNIALYRLIYAVLIAVFSMHAAASVAYAATAEEGDYLVKKGTLEDNGITLEELTADCYSDPQAKIVHMDIERLKKIENWPSERLLEAAKEEHLVTTITVDKIVHMPTDPTQWLDSDKKTKDYYTTILISLFLESDNMYDDSEYEPSTRYLDSDNEAFGKLQKNSRHK